MMYDMESMIKTNYAAEEEESLSVPCLLAWTSLLSRKFYHFLRHVIPYLVEGAKFSTEAVLQSGELILAELRSVDSHTCHHSAEITKQWISRYKQLTKRMKPKFLWDCKYTSDTSPNFVKISLNSWSFIPLGKLPMKSLHLFVNLRLLEVELCFWASDSEVLLAGDLPSWVGASLATGGALVSTELGLDWPHWIGVRDIWGVSVVGTAEEVTAVTVLASLLTSLVAVPGVDVWTVSVTLWVSLARVCGRSPLLTGVLRIDSRDSLWRFWLWSSLREKRSLIRLPPGPLPDLPKLPPCGGLRLPYIFEQTSSHNEPHSNQNKRDKKESNFSLFLS